MNSDDAFLFHIYGEFQDTFPPNSTIDVWLDCGSHCEEYRTLLERPRKPYSPWISVGLVISSSPQAVKREMTHALL